MAPARRSLGGLFGSWNNRGAVRPRPRTFYRPSLERLEPRTVPTSIPFGATTKDTSEYMLGTAYVDVVLFESTGAIDPDLENWTADQINTMKNRAIEGLAWWEDTLAAHSSVHTIDFTLNLQYADAPVATPYEPINRPSTDLGLWVDNFLDVVGANTAAGFVTDLQNYNHARRLAAGTNWAFTIFFVNATADPDDEFADGVNAFARGGGPYFVMTSGNSARTLAHETGHIFYALDEYPGFRTYTDRRGYYNTQNLNAFDGHPDPSSRVPSIMAEIELRQPAYEAHISSPSSLQMIGWQDSDGDGVFDVLDVPLSLTGSGAYNPANSRFEFQGSSSVQTLPNINPSGLGNDITLNKVSRAEYRLDAGPWTTAATYGTYSASVALSLGPFSSGGHGLDIRTVDDVTGVTSPVFHADFAVADVTVVPSGGGTAVGEGGPTDTYSLVLASQPTADVVITPGAGGQLTVSPTFLTFTPANWNVSRDVTVSAIDDAIAEGSHAGTITHTVTSGDSQYNAMDIDDLPALITDNDSAGVTLAQTGGNTSVAEGGATDSYTIALTSEPTADVIVTPGAGTQLGASPELLTFTAANWNIPQPVTVTAMDDAVPEGMHLGTMTHSASSADPMYQGLGISAVVADVADNDIGVVVIESSGSTLVSEAGSTDTYFLALSTQPTADVVITPTGDAQVGASPVALTFTASNWNVPQAVTVTAAGDLIAEGTHAGTIGHSASSLDASYDDIPVAGITATITDDDTAGIVVTPTSGLTTNEFGTAATFTVVLTSVPTGDVTVAVTSLDATEGAVSSGLLTFTPANALTPQTVTVTGVNDVIDDGHVPFTVATGAAVSADPFYSTRDAADVSVTNLDDDAWALLNTFTVLDDEGDRVTVRLTRPGMLVFSQQDPDQNGIGPVHSIYVSGTDSKKSRLTVTVVKARGTVSGLTTIGSITGSGLKGITAAKADLVGAGVQIAGHLGGLSIRDIRGGADVQTLGAPPQSTAITAHDIGDGTAISVGSAIRSLSAARFGKGTIVAPSLGTLTIRGDARAGIPADFNADVTLTGAGVPVGRAALARATVRGTVFGASLNVAGNVGSFRSGAFLDSRLFIGFDPTTPTAPLAGGTFTTGLKLGSFNVSGLRGSTDAAFDNSYVAAATIGSVSLRSVDAANDGVKYGLVARERIVSATVRDSGYKLDSTLASPQGVGNFEIWILP